MSKASGSMKEESLNEFLEKLAQLSKEYDVYIGGCGCCGSPFLLNKNGEDVGDTLYLEKDDSYTVD